MTPLSDQAIANPAAVQPRVLFVDHTSVLGGAELSLLDLAAAYKPTSQVVLFSEGPFGDRLKQADIPLQVIPAPQALLDVRSTGGLSPVKVIPALWQMARKLRQHSQDFDIIHANSQKAFVVAALARWLGAPPVVWHLRDIITASHFSALNRRLAIALANTQASRVIVNSQATGDAFVAAGGNPSLVKLVYNGIASAPFEAIEASQGRQVRGELGIPADAPVVGSFSRLSYWKGQHVLLQAVKPLADVHVLLAGRALFGEEDYVASLKDLAAAPELAGRIHWIGFRSDVPTLMSACTIVAHTSTEPEPFGRVIVEGQLAKRPVIATAAGGAAELIQPGETGWLVPPNDHGALGAAIQAIVAHPSQAELLAQAGYHHAKTEFSLDALLDNFALALADVLAGIKT